MNQQTTTRSHFGTLLRRFRLAAGLSQEALAERARMSTVGVGALERGDRNVPYRETVALLARALELSEPDEAQLEAAVARGRRPRRSALPNGRQPESHDRLLPIPLTSFLARNRELADVFTLARERRLVTLCGPAGVGKTRLALEAAALAASSFTDGVRFIDLAPIAEASLVLPTIASALGLRTLASPLEASILALVRDAAMLVLVDNCEHVLAPVAEVVERMVRAAPGVHVLVTSREPLRVEGERIYHVEPLDCDESEGQGEGAAALSPAAHLFLDRAADAGCILNPGTDAKTVSAICRRLDGLPLAIELAAAWTPTLSPGEIAKALVEPFALLNARHGDVSSRHHALLATLGWSYELLSPRERRVFRSCAIFVGGWTLEAARAVTADEAFDEGDVLATVAALVDKSLIVAGAEATGIRYRLLETTREFALHLLHEDDAFASIALRHARYYAGVATRADDVYGSLPTDVWLAPLRSEVDNFRAALRFALGDPTRASLAATLAGALHWFWFHRGSHREGVAWCEASLTALGRPNDVRTEARLQLALVSFYSSVRGLHSQLETAERAVTLYRSLDEPAKLVAALRQLAETAVRCGQRDEAEAYATEALAIARELGDDRLLAETLRTKSFTMPREEYPARRALLADSVALMNHSRHDDGAAQSLVWLGEVEFAAECYEAALEYARAALATFRRLRFDREIIVCLANIAAYSLGLGELEVSREAAREALDMLATGTEVCGGLTTILQHLAAIALQRGDALRSARLVGFCDASLARSDQPRYPTEEYLYERLIHHLTHALGEEVRRVEMTRGAAYRDDEAVAEALAVG